MRGRTDDAVDVACRPRSRDCSEPAPVEVEAPNDIVIGIGDIQPVAIDGQSARMIQRAGNQAADCPSAVDGAYPVVERVGDVEDVPFRVPGNPIR